MKVFCSTVNYIAIDINYSYRLSRIRFSYYERETIANTQDNTGK